MPRGRRSRDRIAESRQNGGILPSRQQAEAQATLANAPKPVRDAIAKSCEEKQQAEKQVEKAKTRYEKFLGVVKKFEDGDTTRDALGGVGGQVWFEGWNLLFRALGDWSEKEEGPDGFWIRNVDLAQSVPGGVAAFIYVLEKALRPEFDPDDKNLPVDQRRPYMTPEWRRVVSEAAKIAGHLGLSNTIRALRFRWAESADERREKNMAIAERDKVNQGLRDELAQVRAQLKLLQTQGAQGGGAGGNRRTTGNGGGAGNGGNPGNGGTAPPQGGAGTQGTGG
jgi:hypothetical protein